MKPRFVGRLGAADWVTVANAALGFLATAAVLIDISLAARLILLAAITDALDGIVARRRGSTPAGAYLDSLADVASFGVAPAAVVAAVSIELWQPTEPTWQIALGMVVPALYVAMAVTRLGLYTAYDTESDETKGVQTTLAATIIAAALLAGVVDVTTPWLLLGLTAVLAGLMVTTVPYPDLHAQDALIMGVVQALAILFPTFAGRMFPFALLFLALAYLVFGPRYYWQDHLASSRLRELFGS